MLLLLLQLDLLFISGSVELHLVENGPMFLVPQGSSLALTGLTTSSNGYEYRVKLTSSAGAEEVISDAATLTVDDNTFA